MSDTTTTVKTEEIDIDSFLQQPGADVIMTAAEKIEADKPSFFTNKKDDLTFLNKSEKTTPDADDDSADDDDDDNAPAKKSSPDTAVITDDLNKLGTDDDNDDDDDSSTSPKKTGRPTGLVELTQKLIEKGMITPFEGDEDVSKYTQKDFEELFEANEEEKKKKVYSEISTNFFDNLPEQLQYAAKYVADGGTDLKGLFRVLADVQETVEIDVSTEQGQEAAIRQYLTSTRFGTADEIEEQIEEWKDLPGQLEKKASNFKPKLDALKEQQVAKTLEKQELNLKRQREQAETYMENVYTVLEKAELNGLKLDKKMQNTLYSGLVNPSYRSITGKTTNLLGHLLEKYQWSEPRHDLIAETLWLLSDPDGYKEKIREGGKKAQVEDTVRKLKTEERNRSGSSSQGEDAADNKKNKTGGIPRQKPNFFKRNN